ncbi:MAG: 30S ribosomal protein S6 [Phycisphaeraceae bacterium]|nr:30S ribosomal protein S6 [Phycisphaerae bacterium]MBX3393541.1 30S ribosomal protein S6 [Phycisphaeraceae bacterium]
MPGRREYTYEAMFLFSQGVAADLGGAIDHLKEIIARGHGEILAMRKWDDRRLAYEIDGQKRGVYILVYFKAPNDQLSHIERDCNLSEKVLRVLILRADHLSIEEIQAADARKELDAEIRMRGSSLADAGSPAPASAQAAESAEPAAAN